MVTSCVRLWTARTRSGVLVAAATLSVLAAVGSTAFGAPTIERGWPKVASGAALPGPAGDVVFVAGDNRGVSKFHVTASSFSRTGSRRWVADRPLVCGNCDDNGVLRVQPDGTYGPLGATGDDFWAVNRSGRIVDGCSGVVREDGTCIRFLSRPGASPVSRRAPVIQAHRGAQVLWEYAEPNYYGVPVDDLPARIVPGRDGGVYVAYDIGEDGLGQPVPGRVTALGPDGSLRWQVVTSPREHPALVGAIDGGALVIINNELALDGELVLIDEDGSRRWVIPGVGGSSGVTTDARRDRVYFRSRTGVVVALDGRTGKRLWRSTARRVAAVGRSGRVYLADDGDGRVGAVRSIGLDGRLIWRFPVAGRPVGAAELSDGRVALTTADGLAFRLRPNRSATPIRRSRLRLSRSTIRTGCGEVRPRARPCGLSQRWGTVLRMQLVRQSRIEVSVERGRRAVDGFRPVAIDAPRGRSFFRLFAGDTVPLGVELGSAEIVIAWREGGRRRERRFPVVFRQ